MLMFVLIFLEIISTFSQLATELCLARNLRPSRMVKRGDAIALRIFKNGVLGGKRGTDIYASYLSNSTILNASTKFFLQQFDHIYT